MSLLLDALRRAEEARRAKEAEGSSAPASGSNKKPDPDPPAPVAELPAPEFGPEEEPQVPRAASSVAAPRPTELLPFNAYDDSNLSLEALTPPPAVSPPPSKIAPVAAPAAPLPVTPPLPIPQNTAQQEIARNVFAVKQANSQLARETGNRKWLLPVVAVILVTLGTGGWYVWQEIDKMSRASVARAPSPPSALPRAAPNTGQVDSKPAVPVEPPPKVDQQTIPPLLPPPAIEPPVLKLAALPTAERAMTEREAIARKLKDAPIAKEAEVGLKLTRSFEPAKISPDLSAAYNSLAAGDYATAVQQYGKLVAAEPLNVDAQLGLATAAARSGDKNLANLHYRRVLALDPRNGLAIMGLVALSDGVPPASLEIELKTLIGRNPEAAPLHFALGNLYSSGLRWTEAQQAYFDAFRIEPQNADYLFNLAVSLDQLKQPKLALDYYRKAASIALASGGGQFDRGSIAKRIRELSEAARVN